MKNEKWQLGRTTSSPEACALHHFLFPNTFDLPDSLTVYHRVQNPLLDRRPWELEGDVKKFHARVGLDCSVDVDILVRGAMAAQNPYTIDSIRGMTDVEKATFRDEKQWGFREQTEELKVAILVTAFAAIIQ